MLVAGDDDALPAEEHREAGADGALRGLVHDDEVEDGLAGEEDAEGLGRDEPDGEEVEETLLCEGANEGTERHAAALLARLLEEPLFGGLEFGAALALFGVDDLQERGLVAERDNPLCGAARELRGECLEPRLCCLERAYAGGVVEVCNSRFACRDAVDLRLCPAAEHGSAPARSGGCGVALTEAGEQGAGGWVERDGRGDGAVCSGDGAGVRGNDRGEVAERLGWRVGAQRGEDGVECGALGGGLLKQGECLAELQQPAAPGADADDAGRGPEVECYERFAVGLEAGEL